MAVANATSTARRLLWWRAAALSSLFLATGLGVAIGLTQAPQPVTFEGGSVTGFLVLKSEIADYGTVLAATRSQTITLLRVRLILVPGYATRPSWTRWSPDTLRLAPTEDGRRRFSREMSFSRFRDYAFS